VKCGFGIQMSNNLWAIVTTVIGFYFASRVIDNKISAK